MMGYLPFWQGSADDGGSEDDRGGEADDFVAPKAAKERMTARLVSCILSEIIAAGQGPLFWGVFVARNDERKVESDCLYIPGG